jgi:hypothetical protein
MSHIENIMGGLGAFGEAADAVLETQRAEAVAPAGEDLVGIGLMPDIPDDLVARGVEDAVQGDGPPFSAQVSMIS